MFITSSHQRKLNATNATANMTKCPSLKPDTRGQGHSMLVSDCRMDWVLELQWNCTTCSIPFLEARALLSRGVLLGRQLSHRLRHFLFSSHRTWARTSSLPSHKVRCSLTHTHTKNCSCSALSTSISQLARNNETISKWSCDAEPDSAELITWWHSCPVGFQCKCTFIPSTETGNLMFNL